MTNILCCFPGPGIFLWNAKKLFHCVLHAFLGAFLCAFTRSELAFKDSQLFGHDSSNYIIFRKRFHVENRRKWFIDCSFSRHFHFACCAQLKTARWLDLKITKHFLAKLFAFWSHCENCWQRLRNGLVGTHAIFFHTAVEWTSLIMGLPVSPHSINYNPSGTRKHSP